MNGFYPMLNDVHDKAVKELPLAECALFEHIWRKLIGWNKFEDEISISQLVKETSACRATIINLLKNLEAKRWIIVTRQESKTKRKFTSKIALPRCPGIESRLGWSNKYTRGGLESTPGGSLESRPTTDSSSTDSLQTVNNNKIVAPLPEKKSRRDMKLANGMTRGELLDMIEFKPAVINFGKVEHVDMLAYLGEQPRERIEWAVSETREKRIGASGCLKWIYNGVDQYEYRVNGNGGNGQSIASIREAKESANLALMKEELADLESRTTGDWSAHIMSMKVAIAEAEVG